MRVSEEKRRRRRENRYLAVKIVKEEEKRRRRRQTEGERVPIRISDDFFRLVTHEEDEMLGIQGRKVEGWRQWSGVKFMCSRAQSGGGR